MSEIWKDISSGYQISNIGEVSNGKDYLTAHKTKSGYMSIYLKKINKNCTIHRLVASAFIPNPESKPQVNHKNGIKSDNRVENLEWVTPIENVSHSIKTGLSKKTPTGELNKLHGKYNNHLSKAILQIDIVTGEVLSEWPSLHEITRVKGWDNRPISLCALGKGRRKTAYGFKWKYKINNNENTAINF